MPKSAPRTQSIIRYLMINLDEHLARMEKDKIAQSKIVRKGPPAEAGAPATICQTGQPRRRNGQKTSRAFGGNKPGRAG